MKTLAWRDGSSWTADDDVFARTTDALAKVADMIVGLAPVLERWKRLAATGDRVEVDALAPSEFERAVFTAGLERAAEVTRRDGSAASGSDDARAFATFVEKLEALHQLFATDVTRST